MKILLSYGAGVNSTAMLIKCAEQKCWNQHEIQVIFSDTGCEHPETMQYLEEYAKPFCEKAGFKFVIVKGYTESGIYYPGLIEYCRMHNYIPSRRFRWCTDKFKIRIIAKYEKELNPDLSLIGFDAGESHRVKGSNPKIRYPLIEGDIDRQDCIEIIRGSVMPIPRKSGCFICPFQRKDSWAFLKRDYPELFQIAVDLERNNADERFNLGSETSPLNEWLKDYQPKETADQLSFDIDPDKDMPCFCTT